MSWSIRYASDLSQEMMDHFNRKWNPQDICPDMATSEGTCKFCNHPEYLAWEHKKLHGEYNGNEFFGHWPVGESLMQDNTWMRQKHGINICLTCKQKEEELRDQ